MTVRPIATIEGRVLYNDLFAVNKCLLLKEIFSAYKAHILSHKVIIEELNIKEVKCD